MFPKLPKLYRNLWRQNDPAPASKKRAGFLESFAVLSGLVCIAVERIYFQRFDLPGRGSQKEISYPHGHCQRIFVAPICFLHVSLYVFRRFQL